LGQGMKRPVLFRWALGLGIPALLVEAVECRRGGCHFGGCV
jgi:hypothetical protein